MPPKPLSVGLVGCGWIAELVHIPNLKARADVRVVAVADPSESRRNLVARHLTGARLYQTAQELFADADVEAVIMAVPPTANRSLAEGAFSAGKHVYIEKPLAIDVESAKAIVTAWRRSNRIAMLGYNFRFNPSVVHARSMVKSGTLGKVLALQSRFTWAPQAVENWRADAAQGGGVLLDLASHHIDLFSAITGDEVVRVSAHERSIKRRADTIDMTLEGAQGAIHHLHASLAGGANTNRLSLLCEAGQVDVDLQDAAPPRPLRGSQHLGRRQRLGNALRHLHPARIMSAPGYEPSFAKALDAFIEACRTGVQPTPDLSAGLHVMQVIAAARLSSRKFGEPVAVLPVEAIHAAPLNQGGDVTRVLILHDYAGRRGGAEIIAQDLRAQLRERGHDARLLTSDADPFSEADAPDYLCHGEAGGLRAVTEAINLSSYAKLRAALSGFRPDIVHMFMFLTQLSPVVLSLLKDVPTIADINTYRVICPSGTRWIPDRGVCTLRAGDSCRRAGCFNATGILPRRLQMTLLQRYRANIDMTVAPSRAMAQILEANDCRVDHVLPYSVPYAEPAAERSVTPLFGFAGRLVPEKGVAWLLNAFAHAFGSNSKARLLIIGDGPEKRGLEALAAQLGISHATSFLGHRSRSETQSLLQPAWAQIIPSLWPEPFGLVTAEAMMRGSAVIVSDQGASSEIVDDERAGWVVPGGDVARLASALAALAEDRDRALAMGAVARGMALERYSTDKWVSSYLDLYAELLAKCGRSAA